jgi:hypothetical protein
MLPRPRTDHRLLALCAALAFAQAAGCGSSSALPGEASARIAVSVQASLSNVAKVSVTISKGSAGGSDFTPIVADLQKVGTSWSGFVTGIPAGPGRQFDVVALDAAGATVATGTGKADVVAGGTATVVIVLGSLGPPYDNNAPVIDYVSASETLVAPGGKVRLSVSAHDPDPSDTIFYAWVATCGTFADPTKTEVEWTAPDAPGSCQLSVAVSDNRGATVAAELVIEVGVTTGAGRPR